MEKTNTIVRNVVDQGYVYTGKKGIIVRNVVEMVSVYTGNISIIVRNVVEMESVYTGKTKDIVKNVEMKKESVYIDNSNMNVWIVEKKNINNQLNYLKVKKVWNKLS